MVQSITIQLLESSTNFSSVSDEQTDFTGMLRIHQFEEETRVYLHRHLSIISVSKQLAVRAQSKGDQ